MAGRLAEETGENKEGIKKTLATPDGPRGTGAAPSRSKELPNAYYVVMYTSTYTAGGTI